MRVRPLLGLTLLTVALLGADYILPTPDGDGPDPSPPSLTGILEAASWSQLSITADGASTPMNVALTPRTSIFTIYGGVVSIDELVLDAPVEVWFTPESISRKLVPPVAAVVRVQRGR